MSETFAHTDTFNLDLSAWDVSSVTSFRDTFWQAFAFNGDLRRGLSECSATGRWL